MIYLASPYSHPSLAVREYRFIMAHHFTVQMLRLSKPVFSPIVYGKEMESQLGGDFRSWQALNDAMVRVCEMFLVLRIDGWKDSEGVTHEIALAKKLGKSITYVDPIPVSR
jgi:hypothetical protein